MEEQQGKFEHRKFVSQRETFNTSIGGIFELGYNPIGYIHCFPAFAGILTIARFLTLFEVYKKTLGVMGHIAEVGVYEGAGSILFAKLLQIFEPQSLILVHALVHALIGSSSN